MTDLAVEKLRKQLKTTSGDQKVTVVKDHVADALTEFCRQDTEFAQAVMQSDKMLGDCCSAITANCTSSISDLEVYRKAVQFYFPGADIHMTMTIDLCASVHGAQDPSPHGQAPAAKNVGITLDLTDFL